MKPRALFLTVALTACGSVLPQQHGPSTFVPAAMAPRGASCRGDAPKAADPTAVHGLMVWIDSTRLTTANPDILEYLPSDPKLCGASIDFLWSGIDKGPTAAHQYHWSLVEKTIAPWIAAGKRANMLFIGVNEAGSIDTATPSYVLTGPNPVPTVAACTSPGPGINPGPPTPIYWNPRYKGPWRAFIAAVIKKYGRDSRIGYMRFGLGAGAEDFAQHGADGNCFPAWQQHGLSGARFWATFSADLTRYIGRTSRANRSTVQQIVALNPFMDTASPYPVASAVASAAAGVGVGIGTENLGSGNYGSTPEPCTNAEYWCGAFNAAAGTVPEEFQPINFTLDTKITIAPLTSLLPYAMLNHAQIFELYPQEWLTADDPQYPTYCQYHRAWQKTLSQAADILGRSGKTASPPPSPSPCPSPALRQRPVTMPKP
ncbi:MAG TPA: hypothetical protein VGG89_13625 [Candidatus Baltobacteraceae bacterium]